ncbi:MAG: MliC family protein [Alphaproteobacteria bacterium]|nr:MliC family protein [Alphaproteobacteria bacterium]
MAENKTMLQARGPSGMYSAMKKMRFTIIGLSMAVMLSACAAETVLQEDAPRNAVTRPSPESAAAPERVINYRCADGLKVEVTLKGAERAALKIDGAWTEMTAVRAASGAKFQTADGTIVFWSKGNEAVLNSFFSGKRTEISCTIAQ